MRAAWFALGIFAIVALGIGLFAPQLARPRNANTIVHTTTAANADSTGAVSVAEIVAHPTKYSGRRMCLTGYYQQSFEFTAMSARASTASQTLQPPYVWAELNVPTGGLDCHIGAASQQSCFGFVTLCGLFTYKAAAGLGHGGVYRYQLRQ